MAQPTVVGKARGIYYATVGTSLPSPIGATMTWAADGWTAIPDVTEDGYEITFIYNDVKKRPLATMRPTDKLIIDAGMEFIRWASYQSDDEILTLTFPDATHSGAVLTGGGHGGTISYVAMAVHTDNLVWLGLRVSATGNLAMTYAHDFAKPPLEFECFELTTGSVGDPNWECHPYP